MGVLTYFNVDSPPNVTWILTLLLLEEADRYQGHEQALTIIERRACIPESLGADRGNDCQSPMQRKHENR